MQASLKDIISSKNINCYLEEISNWLITTSQIKIYNINTKKLASILVGLNAKASWVVDLAVK